MDCTTEGSGAAMQRNPAACDVVFSQPLFSAAAVINHTSMVAFAVLLFISSHLAVL
jgi:hypothetical protein